MFIVCSRRMCILWVVNKVLLGPLDQVCQLCHSNHLSLMLSYSFTYSVFLSAFPIEYWEWYIKISCCYPIWFFKFHFVSMFLFYHKLCMYVCVYMYVNTCSYVICKQVQNCRIFLVKFMLYHHLMILLIIIELWF